MTKHESFKKRVRERMERTGEKYGAARRSLLAAAGDGAASPGWVSAPDVADERVREHTGHGWDDWVGLIDAGPGRDAGHTAIAAWVVDAHGVSGWWAQTVTVGYERITGLRVPGQRPDGTFTISRTRTLDLDPDTFRKLLLDDDDRAELVPGLTLTLRSKPDAKALRFAVSDGVAGGDSAARGSLLVSMDQAGPRLRVTATHERLGSDAEAEQWKQFWGDWLAALAEA